MKVTQNHPVYSIGVVSELLGVHPETIRTWERSGIVEPPQRRSGKRFYSEKDYRRLQFIHKLIEEGLTLRALHYYLRLYPCWKNSDCSGCVYSSYEIGSTKPCWQEDGTLCHAPSDTDPCAGCQYNAGEVPPETIETKPHNGQDNKQPGDITVNQKQAENSILYPDSV